MEKALELLPSGIVCVWTHKAILPEVVSIMHGLGMVFLDIIHHECVRDYNAYCPILIHIISHLHRQAADMSRIWCGTRLH
jgi:hypothetical protein